MTLLSSLRRIQEGTYGGTGLDSAEVIAVGQTKAFDYYSTLDSMPYSGETGRKAYVAESRRMFIRNGNGWYNAATVNLSVQIDSVEGYDSAPDVDTYNDTADSFEMRIIATDSDDNPAIFTYSHTLSAGIDSSDVVITHDSAKSPRFNIALNGDSASANSFSITFTVSDGINTDNVTKVFNIAYAPPPPPPGAPYRFDVYHAFTAASNSLSGALPSIEMKQSVPWSYTNALEAAIDSAASNSSNYTFTNGNYPAPVYLTFWDSSAAGPGTNLVWAQACGQGSPGFGSYTYGPTIHGIYGAAIQTTPVDDGTGTFFAGQHRHNYSGSSVSPEASLTVDSNLRGFRFLATGGSSAYRTYGTTTTFNDGAGNETFDDNLSVNSGVNGGTRDGPAFQFNTIRLYAETANTSNLLWEASVPK